MGIDASEHDPVATFKLTNDGFTGVGRRSAALNPAALLVQEGGYLNPRLGVYLCSLLRAVEARQLESLLIGS
jgi:acetoin utilization deacetylase AcuC-like enzyme